MDNDERAIKEPASNLSTGAVLSSLLSGRPMWMLLAVVAFAGAGNWFLLTWYPTLLQDKYQLSSAEAGPAATLWSSVAKYVAVLGGAILADMWYRRNARARALVPGITFTISGPLVVLALLPGIFGWDIAVPLVLMLGLVAKVALDDMIRENKLKDPAAPEPPSPEPSPEPSRIWAGNAAATCKPGSMIQATPSRKPLCN